MNKTLMISALAGVAGVAGAQELAINGDFETGDVSGWQSFPTPTSTFGVTSDAFAGSFAGQIVNNDPASGAVVKQNNLGQGLVGEGDTIEISFYAKGGGEAGGVAFAEFFTEIDPDGTSTSQLLGGAPLGLTSDWQRFDFSVVIGPEDVSGGITLQFAAVTGADSGSSIELFIDNVSVNRIPTPSAFAAFGAAGLAATRRRRG